MLTMGVEAAKAESIDAKNFSCRQFTAANTSGEEEHAKGLAAILYWMAGYHASDGNGTIVDFEQIFAGYDSIVEHCNDNPDDKVLKVAGDHLGSEEPSEKAIDLAVITCEKVLKTPDSQADGLGQILMWLAGYQAGYADDPNIDLDAFKENAREIGAYCEANPHIGLYAASEKFMSQ